MPVIAHIKRLFGEEFNTLLFLNLLTAALMLPVVTIGPALLALNGTLIKILDNTCDIHRVQEYWRLFKKKFWKGILFELVLGAYGLMILWCISLAGQLGERGLVLWAVSVLMAFLAALSGVCICQIMASVEMLFTAALWNGVCMALGRFPHAFLAALSTYGILFLCYLIYPVSILPLAVLLLSVMAALSVSALFDTLDELVLENCREGSLPETTGQA